MRVVREGNILPLTSRCNLSCIFCSNGQNPRNLEVFFLPPLPVRLVRCLASFLDANRKIVIGEAASRFSEGEPFTHPGIWEILGFLRRRFPSTLIQITTNGSCLGLEDVRRLAELGPLELNLSLNSATPAGRRLLMGDARPERVLRLAPSFSRLGIKYHGSIVALPHLVGWEDLAATCSFLAGEGAATIRIFLPGYTKHAPSFLHFPPAEMYRRLEEFADEQKTRLGVPVLLEPFLAPPGPGKFRAEVAGVLPGSPAARAGLIAGDVLLEVDGRKVRSRVDAFKALREAASPRVLFLRRGRLESAVLPKPAGASPGVVLNHDFDWDLGDAFASLVLGKRARRVLVLTSLWGYPWLLAALPMLAAAAGAEVVLHPVRSRFFGGSISSAGLLTVSDFAAALREARALFGGAFDLVALPGIAFDARGRDLTGRCYRLLGKICRSEVVLV